MKLILLNDPPGSGKSTLARRYADAHPPALALDVDRIRAMIGGWRATPGEAGLLARDLATAAARTHLAAGHDVVVPQLPGQPGLLPPRSHRPESSPRPSLGGVPESSLSAPTDGSGFCGAG